jgi:hypothetical protein
MPFLFLNLDEVTIFDQIILNDESILLKSVTSLMLRKLSFPKLSRLMAEPGAQLVRLTRLDQLDHQGLEYLLHQSLETSSSRICYQAILNGLEEYSSRSL